LIAAAVVSTLYLGISRAFFPGQQSISYITETAHRGDIVKTVVTTGEVASAMLVNVGAQVSGKIEKLYVIPGSIVKEGDLIAEIDSTTQRNNLASERARQKTYEAQLLSRQIAFKTAQAKYEREVKLKKGDATSTESLESAEQALASAKASLAEAESLILQSQTSVNTAETNLAYTRITAPLNGTVVSVPVKQGQTVNANQTTPTIAQIADLSQMDIKMQISEGDVTKVKPGLKVSYTILSEPDRVFEGVLESVDPGLTTVSDGSYNGSTDSGTAVYYYGKLSADNSDGTLRIGMTTQNSIVIDEARDVLLVPTIALTNIGDRGASLGGLGESDHSGRQGGPTGRRSGRQRLVSDDGLERQSGGRGQGRSRGQHQFDGGDPPLSRQVMPGGPTTGPEETDVATANRGLTAVIMVLEDAKPVAKRIVIGLSDNMNTEVIEGLSEGEQIVTAQMSAEEMAGERVANPGNMRGRSGSGGFPRF
jgi:macrolide-specific efflux system membrane fusion protein